MTRKRAMGPPAPPVGPVVSGSVADGSAVVGDAEIDPTPLGAALELGGEVVAGGSVVPGGEVVSGGGVDGVVLVGSSEGVPVGLALLLDVGGGTGAAGRAVARLGGAELSGCGAAVGSRTTGRGKTTRRPGLGAPSAVDQSRTVDDGEDCGVGRSDTSGVVGAGGAPRLAPDEPPVRLSMLPNAAPDTADAVIRPAMPRLLSSSTSGHS